MRLAISAQERPARNALTVVVSYVNPTRKPVVDAARSSAHPVYRCIKACTRKEPQRTTAKISLAKAHSCAGVVRVRFMDRKERGLTGVRMRPARRVHRVLLDRACVQGHNHCPNLSVCIRKTKFRRCSRSHFPQLRKWRMKHSRNKSQGPPFKKIGRLVRYPEQGLLDYVNGTIILV